MFSKIKQRIDESKSILLIIPSEADWAAIYYSVAFSLAFPEKDISILNNDLFYNKLLINKLSSYKYKSLNTCLGNKFSITIDKSSLQIKESSIDQTDQMIKLSFESITNSLPGRDSFRIEREAFNQDLCIVLQSNTYQTQNNYKNIINGFDENHNLNIQAGEGGEHGQILALNALETILNIPDAPMVYELLTISILIQTVGLSTIPSIEILSFISLAIEKGIDYRKCYTIAQDNYNQDNFSIIKQAVDGVKEIEEGIYSSIINDSENLLNINNNLKPIFSTLEDCAVGVLIISRNIYKHVYIINKSDKYSLISIKNKFNGVGDNNYLYFKSKNNAETLELTIKEMLIEKGEVSNVSNTTINDLPENGPRFTQGLNIKQEC
jgi:hypothetical protein